MKYHVFIERAQDPTPGSTERLAQAIADRYGLPAAAIQQRMAAGRFRVKSNVDMDTASRFATDLERLGAVCTLVEADGAGAQPAAAPSGGAAPTVAAVAPPPLASVAPTPPPPAAPAPPSPNAFAPPSTNALAAALPSAGAPAPAPPGPLSGALSAASPAAVSPEESTAPRSADFGSGLSAAFSSRDSSQDLGALMSGGTAGLSVESLDGADDPEPEAPAASRAATSDAAADSGPVDLFAPPDEQGDEPELSLAMDLTPAPRAPAPEIDDEVPAYARTGADSPTPNSAAEPPPEPAPKKKFVNPLVHVANSDRVRLAAGVLTAVLLGFLPAHMVSGCQEESKFGAIDRDIEAEYQEVKTPEDWDALDDMLAAQKSAKKSAQSNIAITGFGVWLAAGGLLGFLWFRKIDWDRFAE